MKNDLIRRKVEVQKSVAQKIVKRHPVILEYFPLNHVMPRNGFEKYTGVVDLLAEREDGCQKSERPRISTLERCGKKICPLSILEERKTIRMRTLVK